MSGGDTRSIPIRLRSLDQLVDSMDPSPFREQALDRDAAAYLIECAGEHPAGTRLLVAVHGPPALAARSADIAAAIHAHFRLLLAQAERRHRRRRRIGRAAILFGLAVLIAALALRSLLGGWSGAWVEALDEGLLILAWVALWRPLEVALFDRWEDREELRLLQSLARAAVEVRGDDGEPG